MTDFSRQGSSMPPDPAFLLNTGRTKSNTAMPHKTTNYPRSFILVKAQKISSYNFEDFISLRKHKYEIKSTVDGNP